VTGSGLPDGTAVGELAFARALPAEVPAAAAYLDATWPGQATPVTLAWLS
jgi:hypothetical protein